MTPRPYTLVAELSHRCPLACPYCSNPHDFADRPAELSADVWGRVFSEACDLGVVQVHLTGGEPLVRGDLEDVVRFARAAELYVNLVTSGIPLDEARWKRLACAGIDHVQLSIQAPNEALADRIAGRRAFKEKLEVVRFVQATETPLTLNVVLHRENVEMVDEILELAERLDISRVELAHAQYHGFAFSNRGALLPDGAAIERARARVLRAREARGRRLQLVHVLPDYHAGRPKACMDGWGRRYVVVAPDGTALPCHAARSIEGLEHDNVLERSLSWIWSDSSSFNAFRGHGWMKEPCRSCERRFDDFGGCRCQAFALTGDASATDPACSLAPAHGVVLAARSAAAETTSRRYLYRSPRCSLRDVSPAKFSLR
jgi:pyrroloquinoline quinone biosynthesis protein E